MSTISDYDTYNYNMKLPLLDKSFFIDKVDSQEYFDFGCADGALLKFIETIFPKYLYYGYDQDTEMVKRAYAHYKGNVKFIDSKMTSFKTTKPTFILSSVLHEIYSYSSLPEIQAIWDYIFKHAHYIVIRDMIPSMGIDHEADINDIINLQRYSNKAQVFDFQQRWGSLAQNKNMLHFLLKYKYTKNWEREVTENYFALSLENLYTLIPKNYKIIYKEHYVLPYIKRQVKEDFNIEIKDQTHLKIILEKIL